MLHHGVARGFFCLFIIKTARSSGEETRLSLRVVAAVGISEILPASSAADDAKRLGLGGD